MAERRHIGEPPPQTFERGARRALDRMWIAYLESGGDAGDGRLLTGIPQFATGIVEFNRGDYFDAHESFEHAWNAAPYPDRLLPLALSKLGAAFEHARRGNRRGAEAIVRAALACLALPGTFAGVDVEALRRGLTRWLDGTPSAPVPLIESAPSR